MPAFKKFRYSSFAASTQLERLNLVVANPTGNLIFIGLLSHGLLVVAQGLIIVIRFASVTSESVQTLNLLS